MFIDIGLGHNNASDPSKKTVGGGTALQSGKNILWNAFGNIVYLGCQWLVTVFVTRLFGFEDAGVLSLAMSISAMFQTVALFGIRNYQVSDIEQKYSDSTYAGLRTLTCVLAMVLCLIFSCLNCYSAGQLGAILWFMLFRLAEDYSDVLHGIAQKNGRLDIAGKAFSIKGVETVLLFFSGYCITGKLNCTLAMMAAGSCISTAVYDLLCVKKLSSFSLADRLSRCFALGKETLPLCLYTFLLSAISTLPKYILEKLCDASALGAYSSIYAPALLIQAAAGYVYSPFVAPFAEYYRGGSTEKFFELAKRLCLTILGIALSVTALGRMLGDYALRLMFGDAILEYTYLLVPVLISTFLTSYLAFFCMLEVVVRDFKGLIGGCTAGLLLCAVMTPVLIQNIGINGTSYGLIIGAAGAIVCLFVCLRRKLKEG